jgi:hypothetical protein
LSGAVAAVLVEVAYLAKQQHAGGAEPTDVKTDV